MREVRWQDDPERAQRINGHLHLLRDARARLDAAEALLAGFEGDAWAVCRQRSIVAGARQGLDASIGMALFDPAAVPVEEIVQAAGVDEQHAEAVGARLRQFGR